MHRIGHPVYSLEHNSAEVCPFAFASLGGRKDLRGIGSEEALEVELKKLDAEKVKPSSPGWGWILGALTPIPDSKTVVA